MSKIHRTNAAAFAEIPAVLVPYPPSVATIDGLFVLRRLLAIKEYRLWRHVPFFQLSISMGSNLIRWEVFSIKYGDHKGHESEGMQICQSVGASSVET